MAATLNYWTIGSIVIGFLAILPSIMGFFGKNKFEVKGKTILITGASQGMGLSVSKQLAQKGANIVIVARNIGNLEKALAEIQASAASPSTQRFKYISADVCKPEESARVVAEAIKWNNGNPLDIVWCIAGSSHPSLFLDSSREIQRQQMDINYWSAADMAHAILKEWLAPNAPSHGGKKHLIFTSSVVAFYSIAGYAPYSPAKAAIKSLSDSLAQEVLLYSNDVEIHTVFPGTISSPGLETENKTKPAITFILEESDPVLTPDQVAAKSISGLENGDYLVTVGLLGSAMKACAWGGSRRNNIFVDTIMTWITSIAWPFIYSDLDGKVKAYGKKHGHPSTYAKKVSA